MKYVYLIRSINYPDQKYVGITDDLEKRIKDHNSGKSPHTSKYKPLRLEVAIKFYDDQKALVLRLISSRTNLFAQDLVLSE